tara:strand:- start:628 stop:957 length:330 start_codon:yes stop_codon:yes gene_type:complete
MNNIERKIVLNYLRRVNYKDGLFVIVQNIKSKLKSQEQYDNMTYDEKITILKKIVVDYLVVKLSGSMTCYYVNGTPLKRYMRIKELATYTYDNMSIKDAQIIYKKILDN